MIVRVVCGPTAGGKSALALKLAERNGAAIISADSRQVYRGFDIGTAKPDEVERALVPHFGIDVISPAERYSAAKWAEEARGWISDAVSRGLVPLVVGGTGLYIRALFEPLSPVPSLDPNKRADLDEFLTSRSTHELRRWCELLDPSRAQLGRTQLIRAIETALLSGTRLSESYDTHRAHSPSSAVTGPGTGQPLEPSYLLVDPGLALQPGIEERFDGMVRRGWLDEVRRLAASVPGEAAAWKASGYSVMADVARGSSDLATARARVIIETRQYAKRQRTWFRNQLPPASVKRFDPGSPGGDLLAQLWWEGSAE